MAAICQQFLLLLLAIKVSQYVQCPPVHCWQQAGWSDERSTGADLGAVRGCGFEQTPFLLIYLIDWFLLSLLACLTLCTSCQSCLATVYSPSNRGWISQLVYSVKLVICSFFLRLEVANA